ncbi:hypothetical protein R75461_05292 [Paraburkholderia nemoris]|uniref:hypothetical protein n=1 Tax=Paraburkholderia nemoris TaxID=2793076 RepID=UPI0019093CB0|nr:MULTISPECIES: hypothetical protein [Paraburkholderia]MBK3783948.1 hypothetical protein [Paraburkholderia aspalathi]CAE6803291.1 hypothetical protein R75461_05292 [Paraburkholderia nemoris]
MNNRTVAVGMLCMGLFATAYAQQPPTDTDLKAAYCIGVMQQEIAQIPQGMPASIAQSRQDQLNHLQAYLVPRMQYVDPLGPAAARARGQTDSKVITDPDMIACTSRCTTPPNVDPATAMKQCALSCDTEHRLPRIWACNDLSWLPF